MFDEHISPVLVACSEPELAVLIEFLGRPPSGLLWTDRRLRDPLGAPGPWVAAVVERILRLGAHSVLGRTPPGGASYLQILCDALAELGLSEEPAAGGIGELELRVVRYALDAHFERLPPDTQEALVEQFRAGELFAAGIPDVSALHDFLSHAGPERRALKPAHVAVAAGDRLRDTAIKQAKSRLLRAGLRVVLRGAAGPVYNAIKAWSWLGPAFRYTVPVITYLAYLRARQADEAGAARGADAVLTGS